MCALLFVVALFDVRKAILIGGATVGLMFGSALLGLLIIDTLLP
jgi:hypothetical protein